MQEIIFRNEEHKEIYYKLLNRINPQYRIHSDMRSMIYLIALNETEAFGLADQIFDFQNRLITPNILNDA